MSATDLHDRLHDLQAQRAAARASDRGLDDLIAAARHAYVGMAVTEIATFRAQLSGPQAG
jgi:hypothetical protein